MTRTNYGNGYKFKAIMERRSSKDTVSIQAMRKDGSWGKAREYKRFGCETDEQVVERLTRLNNQAFRLAE